MSQFTRSHGVLSLTVVGAIGAAAWLASHATMDEPAGSGLTANAVPVQAADVDAPVQSAGIARAQ